MEPIFFHALLAHKQKQVSTAKSPVKNVIDGAWTWFGRPNWAFSSTANKYWIGAVVSGRQYVIEHDLNTGDFSSTPVATVYQFDDHNQTQFLIRQSDERILVFYVEHNGDQLRWRISDNPLDASSFGTEYNLNPFQNYSYISPYQNANGDIFVFYRVNNSNYDVSPEVTDFKWYYMKSTDGGLTFGTSVELFNCGANQAYLISSQDGDKIHFCATDAHPQHQADQNVSIFHFYFDMDTETVHKTDGTQFALPAIPSNMTNVFQATGTETSWILDVITKNGVPRILYAFYPQNGTTSPAGKEKYLRFAEWNGSAWKNKTLAKTMSRYIETDLEIDELYYTGASRFNTANPDLIIAPIQIDLYKPIELFQHDLRNGQWKQLTFDSENDNWRPMTIPCDGKNLVWLNNEYYNTYTDFKITIKATTISNE